MTFRKTGIAKCLLAVLIIQHGVFAMAGVSTHATVQADNGTLGTMQMEHDCAGMMQQSAATDAGEAMLQDGHQHASEHGPKDCVDSGCDDCMGCAACVAGQVVSQSSTRLKQQQDLVKTVFVLLARQESLYRPPIS